MAVDGFLPDEKDAEYTENPWFITSHLKTEYDDVRIIKIVSGANHMAMRGDDSRLYTCGAWEQGQLGRDQSMAPRRQTRTDPGYKLPDKEFNLRPEQCEVGHKYRVRDVWAGRMSTFCYAGEAGQIYVCGNNLYAQLGIKVVRWDIKTKTVYKFTKNNSFNKNEPGDHLWKQIAAGDHHTVALTSDGKVYTIGRPSNGRLGLGTTSGDDVGSELKEVPTLRDKICVAVAAGQDTSYALTIDNELYSWGAGKNCQLALEGVEDQATPQLCKAARDRLGENKEISRKGISVGVEHVGLIVTNKSSSVHDVSDDDGN